MSCTFLDFLRRPTTRIVLTLRSRCNRFLAALLRLLTSPYPLSEGEGTAHIVRRLPIKEKAGSPITTWSWSSGQGSWPLRRFPVSVGEGSRVTLAQPSAGPLTGVL